MDDELNAKDYIDAGVRTLMSSVPYVGDGLVEIFYGFSAQREMKRFRSFYEKLIPIIMEAENLELDTENQDQLVSIIETIHEEIRKLSFERKQSYFVNAYANLLNQRKRINFDEEEYFIEVLSSMTIVEIDFLVRHQKDCHSKKSFSVRNEGTLDKGVANRLRDYGFLEEYTDAYNSGAKYFGFSFSDLGVAFSKFILTPTN
ncbi:hypothetical protein [Enterococcus devriesei]|uniref:hypothetical protein n=1 Tax=Enterococcus devriesei TaxID=319970 RepID=UPI0036D2F105